VFESLFPLIFVADVYTKYSTGRGGIGNIDRSRSSTSNLDRSQSRNPLVQSSGRGAARNINLGGGSVADTTEEEERKHLSTCHDG
jgi:hypothetical protein